MAHTGSLHRNLHCLWLLEMDMIAHHPKDGWRALTTDPAWPGLSQVQLLKWMTETDLIFMGWLLWDFELERN